MSARFELTFSFTGLVLGFARFNNIKQAGILSFYNTIRLLKIRILNIVMPLILLNHIYTGVARLIIFVESLTLQQFTMIWFWHQGFRLSTVSLEESVKYRSKKVDDFNWQPKLLHFWNLFLNTPAAHIG